ncbi:UNVERIFIED_CONTAM: Polyadenylate-binding protein 2 [Sesamum latifolium]|uniref:Polyadenylate-binding protein 2 n=1 Tax=Sesamum latifolium TaxID=2727402 RepID=A0AAW2U200_9LAMI
MAGVRMKQKALDHLGSNLSLYMQPRELQPDGASERKPTAGEQAGKTDAHQIESEAEKADSDKTSGHHQNRDHKGSVRDGDENGGPLPNNSLSDNVNSQDEPHGKVGQTKPSLSPRSTIQKKRRRTEEKHLRKRKFSESTVSAPRRLLQFAVRDAVATSRPSNLTAEPSLKRLLSVVSASTGDSSLEERPQRIQHTSMSVAIKVITEAVKDVSKARPSRNVFDRLGRATDVAHTTTSKNMELLLKMWVVEFLMVKWRTLTRNMVQEKHMLSFHDFTMDSNLGYAGEGYGDVDVRVQEAKDVSQSGTSGWKWVENSLIFQYGAGGDANERLHGQHKYLGQPATVPNASLGIASSIGMNTRKHSQYQEESEGYEMEYRKIVQGSDGVAGNSEVWLMKENNNPAVAFNENAKPDKVPRQSQKTEKPTGSRNTGLPREDADSRTIFVSNVHFAATKDSLSLHFNKFGEVLKVIILSDSTTGQPKGSAYIEFMRKDAAELALSLDGTSFMSRILKIVRKGSAQPEAASVVTWPRIARASPFDVPRFGRVPFARGIPSLYRARMPIKPGGRSFQWKRECNSTVTEASGQTFNTTATPPTIRSLTYVRTEPKTNGSSGTA